VRSWAPELVDAVDDVTVVSLVEHGAGLIRWTGAQVRARRLARHHLSVRDDGASIPDVVAAMGGAHAQIMSAAELSIGLRMDGVSRTDVRQALWQDHSLIKTFGPRGTVHLLPAIHLPMWTGALSAIPTGSGPSADTGMTAERIGEVVDAISAELIGDVALTTDELGARVVAATGSWAGDLVVPAFTGMWPRWRLAIPAAAHRGVLCFGPDRGRTVTYTNPKRWLPGFRPAASQGSLRDLLRLYLGSFGPATSDQFAQWLATPKPWAADLFESLAGELTAIELQRSRAWLMADDSDPSPRRPSGVRLLPYFDAYVVGCHPRKDVFPGAAATRGLSRGQAGTVATVLVNGVVAGIWHQRRAGRRVAITVEMFDPPGARQQRELENEVERTAAIVEATPTLTYGPVSAGRHL